jgi:DNA primase
LNALDQIKDISIRDDLYPGELRNDAGPCPFPGHGKQTGQSPPFKFFAKDNGFKCFGCGARGSAIDFWMALKGLIFPEAVRDLAERHRIELEPWTPEQEARVIVQRRREDAINWMATYHEQQLTEGTPEWEYLVSRGFTADVIREYHLGVDNKTMLGTIRRHPDILTAVGLTEQDLVDAGGVYENAQTKKRRSFLGGRITFPITKRGRVVGISGRAGPVPPDVSPLDPKYLNLKGIPLSTLFLEDSIRNEADVCEGLPDTLTLAMMNFPACGQQGTSGMDSHAHKFKSCQRVYTWFDTDDAGQRATARVGQAIHDQLKRGEVRVCLLPAPFKDVNEAYLQKGARQGAGSGRLDDRSHSERPGARRPRARNRRRARATSPPGAAPTWPLPERFARSSESARLRPAGNDSPA